MYTFIQVPVEARGTGLLKLEFLAIGSCPAWMPGAELNVPLTAELSLHPTRAYLEESSR